MGLLSTYLPWPWPILWGVWLVVLVAGFVIPVRFSRSTSVKVASNERALQQARSLALTDCAGSRPRWYRNAEVGVHASGDVNGNIRTASVVLRATKRGVRLFGAGIETQDRRTRAWTAVTDAASGHSPSGGALYRTGGMYFKVEGV